MMRPNLDANITPDQFKVHYWEKKELVAACRIFGLASTGAKDELTDRIYHYLKTGEKKTSAVKAVGVWDSDSALTLTTPVRHYRNDAATRAFFERYIAHFRYNLYLREHAKKSLNELAGLTYGDLVEGWKLFEEERNVLGFKPEIGKQFQYNQFIQDYFKAYPNAKRQDAIQAWKVIRQTAGEHTFRAYLNKNQ